ncbi:FecR domain-containing protein [Bordetella sp. N]|uniref:FecR domain-containing protein n=1 Tax=Bordetella sp. N TaxID=1746199 RepID=UPI00070BF9DA|nr:FecR family protein [Bordetella sp. N]ALM83517.1 iron dicitrate transport regulator FecR [Bordetella sp. N]
MSAQDAERLPPDIIKQAAQWMMRAGDSPDAATQAACARWRASDARHELAWQRLQGISQDMNAATGLHVAAATASNTVLRYCDQRTRRNAIKWVMGGIGLGTVGLIGVREGLWGGIEVYRTATGEQRVLTLPDGTVLTMNTDSTIALHYDSQQRRIDLRSGEIVIATAQDPAGRPFSVKTRNGLLTPLGTRFMLRQLTDNQESTRLAVFEGAVRIDPAVGPQPSMVLHAGEQVDFGAGAQSPVTPAQDETVAWTQGMLVGNRMRLDQFLAELGRYRAGFLRCDPEVAGREVTGAFRIDDTDKALEVLASVLGLSLRYRTRYWVTVGRA